jgi:site-specific DNA recombinase
LAESIHEMFDEYYSVSLSFWTRTGLREKARQVHLVGGLPWGYSRDPDSALAVPDPERAPLVRELFERYAGGQESDRSLAAWLNAKGARSAKDRPFTKDTVREILLNSAYCGYVGGLRSKDRSVRGLHEPIVSEELFDRVQEVRSWRARVVKPGPPSEDYLLRKLLHCERCGARMHGTRGSRPPVRRYLCSTRRHGDGCDQPSHARSRSRNNSSIGSPTLSPTRSYARRSSRRFAAPPTASTTMAREGVSSSGS